MTDPSIDLLRWVWRLATEDVPYATEWSVELKMDRRHGLCRGTYNASLRALVAAGDLETHIHFHDWYRPTPQGKRRLVEAALNGAEQN